MKYSICRAMTELKTLKARYQKELSESKLIAVKRGSKLLGNYSSYKEEDFNKQSEAMMQSLLAIEKRIVAIKSAINASNYSTRIKIGEREMTVQEALVEKDLIQLKKDRLSIMKSQMSRARREYEVALDDNRKRVEKMVQDQVQGATTLKADDASKIEQTVLESVEKLYKVDFVDASGLDGKITTLEAEIADFENNVDYALSESNSTTYIEVAD